MVRLAVRIVTIVLAAYGAGTLGLRALTADRSDGDGVWTLHAYPSPDGAMKAVVTIYEGGHFLAPYCNSGVSVLPIGANDGKAKAAALQVFSGICGNFKGVSGVSQPNVRWLDNKRLTIDFPTRFNEGQSKTEYVLANLDASKQISVSYSAHE